MKVLELINYIMDQAYKGNLDMQDDVTLVVDGVTHGLSNRVTAKIKDTQHGAIKWLVLEDTTTLEAETPELVQNSA